MEGRVESRRIARQREHRGEVGVEELERRREAVPGGAGLQVAEEEPAGQPGVAKVGVGVAQDAERGGEHRPVRRADGARGAHERRRKVKVVEQVGRDGHVVLHDDNGGGRPGGRVERGAPHASRRPAEPYCLPRESLVLPESAPQPVQHVAQRVLLGAEALGVDRVGGVDLERREHRHGVHKGQSQVAQLAQERGGRGSSGRVLWLQGLRHDHAE
eukprot:scaffold22056_cov113-Isochrysis_galbana.AAC.2